MFVNDHTPEPSALERALSVVLPSVVLPSVVRAREGNVYYLSVSFPHGHKRRDDQVHPAIRELESRPLSGALSDELDEIETDTLTDEERLIVLQLRIKLRRRAEQREAHSARLLTGDEAPKDPAQEELVGEFSFAYRIARTTAISRIASVREAARLPQLDALHEKGAIDVTHMRAVAEETANLRDTDAAEVDRVVAEKVERLGVIATRDLARKTAQSLDKERARDTEQRKRKSASVTVIPHTTGDGADLILTGPATDIKEMQAAINTAAGLCEHDTSMTTDARRFYAAKRLLLGGLDKTLACPMCSGAVDDLERGSKRRRARNRVVITMPDETLRGDGDGAATVEGFGPVPAGEARRFACQPGTTLQRLFFDPATGVATSFDPTRYRLNQTEADLLAFRDGTCMTPGCNRPASLCDADHMLEYGAGGETTLHNEASLCHPDHDAKTQHGFVSELTEDGTGISWTTPLGGRYVTDFRDYRPVHPPDEPELPDPPPAWPDDPTF